MQGSLLQKIIRSGQVTDGNLLASAPKNKLPSALPEMVGKRFGRLKVISKTVSRLGKSNRAYMEVVCTTCLQESKKEYTTLVRGLAGCRHCGTITREIEVPKWLLNRAISAKQRCTNKADSAYPRYGGRGITFEFDSTYQMALWVQQNLGLHRHLQIDRIDNNGPYASWNIRLSTPSQNLSHTRKNNINARLHWIRMNHKEIRYSDATVSKLLRDGLTAMEILERQKKSPPKQKKGKSLILETPDHFIASLSKGC